MTRERGATTTQQTDGAHPDVVVPAAELRHLDLLDVAPVLPEVPVEVLAVPHLVGGQEAHAARRALHADVQALQHARVQPANAHARARTLQYGTSVRFQAINPTISIIIIKFTACHASCYPSI